MIRYAWPQLELEVDCGGGTYIRSIARDIGEALECGGYVETLVRTRTGPFELSTPSYRRLYRPKRWANCFGPHLTRFPFGPATLDDTQVHAITQGSGRRPRSGPDGPLAVGEVALLDPEGRLIAPQLDPHAWVQPRKVLV